MSRNIDNLSDLGRLDEVRSRLDDEILDRQTADSSLSADIAINSGEIASQLVTIETNTADIATQQISIDSNSSDIASQQITINSNTAEIASQLVSIETNTSEIATQQVTIDRQHCANPSESQQKWGHYERNPYPSFDRSWSN